jgi:hypothetical protein
VDILVNNNNADKDCILGRCGDRRLTDAELSAEIQPRVVMLLFWLRDRFGADSEYLAASMTSALVLRQPT